jgi:FkbM family methyltransferase
MMERAQNYLHRKLLERGWLVRRVLPAGAWEAGRAYWDAEYLRRLKFNPATIVDVGVGYGSETLYEAYPKAYLVMVEPLAEFTGSIEKILADRRGRHIPMAVGEAKGRRNIFVEPRHVLGSSFYERCEAERTGDRRTVREVEMTTLDAIAGELRLPKPYGLKLDTEGTELEILRGASDFLRDTIFVIAEASVMNRFEGSYSFEELIAKMDESGFQVCDILDIGRARSTEVTFVDLVFRRR